MDKTPKFEIFIGPHASTRMQQRGIRPSLARMVITFADREIHVGGGRTSFTVTRRHARQLREDGLLAPSQVEQICSKAVVVSNDNFNLSMVTVMHLNDGKKGRHYRKNTKSRQSSKYQKH